MNPLQLPLALVPCLTLLVPAAVPGATIYRCVEGGRTVYAPSPRGGHCETRELADAPTDRQELERRRQEREDWNRRRETAVQGILEREHSAESQRREAALRALGPLRRTDKVAGERVPRGRRQRAIAPAPAASAVAAPAPRVDGVAPVGPAPR